MRHPSAMHHKTVVLVAPALLNSSCNAQKLPLLSEVDFGGLLQAFVAFATTAGVLGANLLLIVVINSRRYSKYIHAQPRYLLTSLASNDLAMGLLVTPFAIVPALRNCWPYGELACQIQALLRGAISQQSAVILICMAMDRYLCMLHPTRYHKHSSKKGCVAIISLTWILSVTLFALLVLPRGGFYFNATGMVACEPFYAQASIRILAACGFYFPTTMILMYCYGSAFHVNKLRLRKAGCATIATPLTYYATQQPIEKLLTDERRLSINTSRTMAAMSLGFIVLVTPWTIQEVVAACTGTRAPAALDFAATWMALSNSVWNPTLYWLLNDQFRRVSRELIFGRICSFFFFCCTNDEVKTASNSSNCSSMRRDDLHTPGCDLEGLSEKYWGEILERTSLSSTLQRGGFHHHHANCNGLQQDGSTPDL